MSTLIMIRHGESEWNDKGLFTGWVDVPPVGARPRRRRRRPASSSPTPACGLDVVHTSVLSRAIETANIALDVAALSWLPVRRSWRLNERHYGALQGKDKAATRAEYGDEQFMLWRRSYDVPPPPLADDDPLSQARRSAVCPAARRAAAADRMPARCGAADAAVLARRDHRRSCRRPDAARGGARQLAPGHGQAPGRHQRRRHRRA